MPISFPRAAEVSINTEKCFESELSSLAVQEQLKRVLEGVSYEKGRIGFLNLSRYESEIRL
tara:strand:- start:626 stop:808 length:183 start_codon:yes stop_codon:yes gene_type:complete